MKVIGTQREIDYLIEKLTISKLCIKCKAFNVCQKQNKEIKSKINKSCGELIRKNIDIKIIEEE